jgi:tRNA (guanine37-N1)-methyltransferase
MRIDILTLFPSIFESSFRESIIKRAQEKGLLDIHIHNLRDFSSDVHHTVDDTPFGGGAGMVMKVEPIWKALQHIQGQLKERGRVILLTPQGTVLSQSCALRLSQQRNIVLLCGRYEGVDERVREYLVDEELSIGDYVLSGGEVAAMVVVDVVARLIPGVVGNELSVCEDSFSRGLLDYPQYTRPAVFGEWAVPEILRSGNHQKIEEWRRKKALEKTLERRPDLLAEASLTEEEMKWLRQAR